MSYLLIEDDQGDWLFAVSGLKVTELQSGIRGLQKHVQGIRPAGVLPPPEPAQLASTKADDPAVRLRRLGELHQQGLVSDE